jgi:hypothetical protein
MEDSGFIELIYIKRIYDELVGYCIIVMLCFLNGTSFGNKSYFVSGVSDFLYKGIYRSGTGLAQPFHFSIVWLGHKFPFQYNIVMMLLCFLNWESKLFCIKGGVTAYIKAYTAHTRAAEMADFFSFQICDWGINFLLP